MLNNINYTTGTKINQHNETFTLLERTGVTYPTKGKWALVEWKIGVKEFLGSRHVDVSKIEAFRTIREIGTPNENFPEEIPGMNYQGTAESAEPDDDLIEGTALSGKDFKKAQKKFGKRGRPAAPINLLKAKNIIRDMKQGKRKSDEPEVIEAFDFMTEIGEEVYLEKHFLPFI